MIPITCDASGGPIRAVLVDTQHYKRVIFRTAQGSRKQSLCCGPVVPTQDFNGSLSAQFVTDNLQQRWHVPHPRAWQKTTPFRGKTCVPEISSAKQLFRVHVAIGDTHVFCKRQRDGDPEQNVSVQSVHYVPTRHPWVQNEFLLTTTYCKRSTCLVAQLPSTVTRI
ncbi:hypothetical protein BDY19DRAFT_908744 [Irpex rosettiformis]|uniref:Uncharacterized protein n=1 Tax=Irpex rosettiformis TaxID=378272 RepID=A0ACB8TUP0_9APHY|nr:hypothetical protein BDY19DRAFT_908744 [Irpex rosettiformis]